jgi:rare lipoprotein A
MFNRNGRSAAPKRRLAVIAGAVFATSAIALSATAETPALASERVPQPLFDEMFAPYELTEAELAADAKANFAAEARLAEAPGDEGADHAIGGGMASYYGAGFAGRPTASGERFNPAALTAAHRTLPFGTRIKVTNPRNGRSVVVRVNDRGPFYGGRMIDLSQEAARQIGLVQEGRGVVQLATLS